MSTIISKILQNISTRIIFIIYLLIVLTTGFFLTYGYYNNLSLQEQRQFDKLKAVVVSIGNNIDGNEHQGGIHRSRFRRLIARTRGFRVRVFLSREPTLLHEEQLLRLQ